MCYIMCYALTLTYMYTMCSMSSATLASLNSKGIALDLVALLAILVAGVAATTPGTSDAGGTQWCSQPTSTTTRVPVPKGRVLYREARAEGVRHPALRGVCRVHVVEYRRHS